MIKPADTYLPLVTCELHSFRRKEKTCILSAFGEEHRVRYTSAHFTTVIIRGQLKGTTGHGSKEHKLLCIFKHTSVIEPEWFNVRGRRHLQNQVYALYKARYMAGSEMHIIPNVTGWLRSEKGAMARNIRTVEC